METIRYSPIFREDLALGTGTREVTLADGRVVALHEIGFLPPPFVYDADRYDTVALAVADIGSTTARLVIAQPKPVLAALTIPSTLTVEFVGQGTLAPASGVTVTFASPTCVMARVDRQIFTGAGTVAFTNPGEVWVGWWGGVADDSTSNHTATLAMYTALPAAGGHCRWHGGTFRYTTETHFTATRTSLKFSGMGASTVIKVLKANANKAFRINNTAIDRLEITGFRFLSDYAGVFVSGNMAMDLNVCPQNVWIHHNYFELLSSGVFFADGGNSLHFHDNDFLNCCAPIQNGGGAVSSIIHIVGNRFKVSTGTLADDQIAISGAGSDVLVAFNDIDMGSTGAAYTTALAHCIWVQDSGSVGSDRVRIIGNSCRNNDSTHATHSHAIFVDTSGGGTSTDIIIAENHIDTCYGGITVENRNSGVKILNNTLRTLSDDGISLIGTGTSLNDIDIIGNWLKTVADIGIFTSTSGRVHIRDNDLDTCGGANGAVRLDTTTESDVIGNRIKGGSADGLFLNASTDLQILANRITNNGGSGINFNGAGSTYPFVDQNIFATNTTAHITNAPASIIYGRNVGWVTKASGTGSVASGATTAVITHGLSVTPTLKDICIVFGEQGSNDYGRWSVGTITSTQFTLTVAADPGASNLDFGWNISVL